MTFVKTMQTPASAENKKWLRIWVRFFKIFWHRLQIQVRKNAESCWSWFQHLGSVATSATLRTIRNCWRHFMANLRLLPSWKRNLEADLNVEDDLICALLCIEPRICMLSSNKQVAENIVLLNVVCRCFYSCSVHVQQLSYWRSCMVCGPGTLYLFINWATCLKRLRTPALGACFEISTIHFPRKRSVLLNIFVLSVSFIAVINWCIN